MPEPLWELNDVELGAALMAMGRDLDVPAATDMPEAVARRLAGAGSSAEPGPEGARDGPPRLSIVPGSRPRERTLRPLVRPWWRRAAVAAAALLVATTGTLVVSPGARHAVAGWLGLRGERIVVVPRPVPTRLGRGLDVGRLVSLTSARAGAAFPVSVPTDPALGPPDEVYLSREVPGGQVTLLYRARPGLPPATGTGAGLLITQFRGSLQREFLEKMVGPGTTIEYLNIGGRPAYWLAGHPHELLYLDANGIQIPESVRLAGNVLIFEKGEVTVRIEGDMPERDALRIARSMG